LIGGLEEIGGASPALHTCGEQNLCKSAKSAVTFAFFMPFRGYFLWVLCDLCAGESFTEFLEFAAIAARLVLSVAAFDDTDSGEGEVIFNGVGGVDFKKTFGDFECGGERRRLLMIEAEDSAEPGHVHVERDDEFGFVDGFPQAGVNLVFADHPAEEEVEALAGAASFGACEEIVEAGGNAAVVLVGVHLTEGGGEFRERSNDILIRGVAALKEEFPDAAELMQDAPQQRQQVGDVVAGCEAVLEGAEAFAAGVVEIADEGGWAAAHDGKKSGEAFFYLLDAAISEVGGEEGDDLHIRRVGVSIDELQRVRLDKLRAVVPSIEGFEDMAYCCTWSIHRFLPVVQCTSETIGGLKPTLRRLRRLFEGLVENPDMAQFLFDDVVDFVSAGLRRDEIF